MRGTAKAAIDGIDKMLNLVYEWEAKVDGFVATGQDDDDVVITHDSTGAMIELTLRKGLQQELTTGELEEAINDAIADNVALAQEGLMAISNDFLEQFSQIPQELAQHPVAARFANALSSASASTSQAGR